MAGVGAMNRAPTGSDNVRTRFIAAPRVGLPVGVDVSLARFGPPGRKLRSERTSTMTDAAHPATRPPLRVGLIGFGAIGRRLAEAIAAGQAGRCELSAVLVRRPERIPAEVAEQLGCHVTGDAADFLATSFDLVVEVAGHEALKAYAEDALRQGKDLLLISVGALADPHFEQRLHRAAHDYGRRVYLATGAIAGLDAISA